MSAAPLLDIRELSIRFGDAEVVHSLSLAIQAGERVALVGESGSGKTVTALSILRLLQDADLSGQIRYGGLDLLSLDDEALRRVRGADIAMIFQEPASALNPLFTIGDQIAETLMLHEGLRPLAARERVLALLAHTGIRHPEQRIDSFPHQLSGGQRQRAMIAMALACRPRLLIADEPTTALDVTIRARIVRLLLDVQRDRAGADPRDDMAVLLITHDLHLVRRFAQRVAVMEHGRLVEVADTETLFNAPQHPYTRRLIDSLPQREVTAFDAQHAPLLEAHAVTLDYPRRHPGLRGWFRRDRFVAVDKVSLSLRPGETLGVIGESGSGKSTLAQALLGLVRPRSGRIVFNGTPLASLAGPARRALGARLQVVFQDPFGSLSPRRTIEQIVGEGVALHQGALDARARRARVLEVLTDVGLGADTLHSYPHEFSGGQRQRIAIARALAMRPQVVVLDEPTSALDVSIQRQVLQLLGSLQRKYRLAYILITHDLQVVRALSHRVLVLKDGVVVESGDTEVLLADPRHPYTRQLIEASL